MFQIKRHSTIVAACVAVVGLATRPATASAVCISPPPGPVCKAQAHAVCSNNNAVQCAFGPTECGGNPCIAVIDGTIDSNGGANVSATLTGSNVVFVPPVGGSAPLITFQVRQVNPLQDGSGVVTGTGSGSCTIPLSFAYRAATGPANNEFICAFDGTYTFKAISGGSSSSPAGTTACAAYFPPDCATDPILPPGLSYLSSNPRIKSIRSPIRGAGVLMEMTHGSTFDARLRLVFSRSTDFGTTFSPFMNITDNVYSGSTIIRGTAEWSDVKVAVVQSAAIFPAMSIWGMALLALLMLGAIIGITWRYGTMSRRASRHS